MAELSVPAVYLTLRHCFPTALPREFLYAMAGFPTEQEQFTPKSVRPPVYEHIHVQLTHAPDDKIEGFHAEAMVMLCPCSLLMKSVLS